ncbi:MAG TPA: phosphoenolpyruvate--protein phosphotransferase [Casimicrobiaceae bacterium]|jgi:phosphotransferase system enzyme I (PtsI)|nr:phosphoenolpyruvate--protein phosphotransferase [Casimicrobiaceae bacterium]
MEKRFAGRPAAPGIALGALFPLTTGTRARVASGAAESEAEALRSALSAALTDLKGLIERSTGDAAAILEFQVALLEDDVLAEPAFSAIVAGRAADGAWLEAMQQEIAGYEGAEDEYFRARAADLYDLRDRVLAHLTGSAIEAVVPPGAIVAAVDLAPSRFLGIDWSRGGALVLTAGSITSHVAMLARSRGIPAVTGLGVDLAELSGQAVVDAHRGVLIVNPGPATRAQFDRDAKTAATAGALAAAAAIRPAVTADGTPIRMMLNISDPRELAHLDPVICDGIGLVRTEFLFHDRQGLPDEEQQYSIYRSIAEWAQGRPVTIRTLDAGGDKPIPGLTPVGESNPFLGVRGLRLSLVQPAVFRTQLRALARAAMHGNVKIMLPMVTQPRELAAARSILDAEVAALGAAGIPARRASLGIMIEVPAAAIAADQFDAEFFSIGSNDLTQYVAAAGRDIGAVADLANPTQPAMLRLFRYVVSAARAQHIEVSLCGDAAGDPRVIPLLLATGLRSLSMAPVLVGGAKLAVAATDLGSIAESEPWPK